MLMIKSLKRFIMDHYVHQWKYQNNVNREMKLLKLAENQYDGENSTNQNFVSFR